MGPLDKSQTTHQFIQSDGQVVALRDDQAWRDPKPTLSRPKELSIRVFGSAPIIAKAAG